MTAALLATVGPGTVVAIIIVAAVVVALAGYLTIVAYLLNKVSFTLGTILIGVRAIAAQAEPVGDVVGAIADDVVAIQQTLHTLLPRQAEKLPARVPHAGARSRVGGRR